MMVRIRTVLVTAIIGALMFSGSSAAVATTAAPSPAYSAALSSPGFTDVPPERQFYDEISWLADTGVTTGYPDGSFRPHQSVARDAMAAFMYRLAGTEGYTPPTVSPFIDVTVDHQFYTEIAWLAEQGISEGWATSQGREYRPQALITRDAMAAFMYRYQKSPHYNPSGESPFRDAVPGRSFYLEIRWLAASGISTGWDVGYGCRDYRPLDNVARDAMAAFMYRSVLGGVSPVTHNTCSPPREPLYPDTVTAGAYCAKNYAGYYGYTTAGTLMQCTMSGTDRKLRWREAS